MHGAGEVDPVERTQFERRIHVTTSPLDGVVGSAAVAHDDLSSIEVDGFHPPRRYFVGAYRTYEFVTHGPHPSGLVAAAHSDR
jgi:hypothetical protein